MRSNPSNQRIEQRNSPPQTTVSEIDPVGVALTIAFPVVVISAIVGFRKYRASVLQRRIKHLNHLWQLDALKKQS